MNTRKLFILPLAIALLGTLHAAPPATALSSGSADPAMTSSTVRELPAPVVQEPPVAAEFSAYEQELLDLTNAHRADHGIPPVKADPTLAEQSRIWSGVMAEEEVDGRPGENFRHNDRWNVAENIAAHSSSEASPTVIMDMWMASPGHRSNILNGDYTRAGFGRAVSGDGTVYVTQQLIW